jgi:urate oxidase
MVIKPVRVLGSPAKRSDVKALRIVSSDYRVKRTVTFVVTLAHQPEDIEKLALEIGETLIQRFPTMDSISHMASEDRIWFFIYGDFPDDEEQ